MGTSASMGFICQLFPASSALPAQILFSDLPPGANPSSSELPTAQPVADLDKKHGNFISVASLAGAGDCSSSKHVVKA